MSEQAPTASDSPQRMRGPVWRIAGAAGGWLVFAFLLALILRAVMTLMLLGGSCASGGPYVIAVECPTALLVVIPWAFFVGIAVTIAGAAISRGFGTQLLSWAWVLCFGGMGVASIIGGVLIGGVWFFITGAMFLLFAVPVLIYEFRSSPLRLFFGATNLRGQGFIVRTGDLRKMFRRKKQDFEQVVDATPADAVIALLATMPFAALGFWLGWITWDVLP